MPHVVNRCSECEGRGNLPSPNNTVRVCPLCGGSGLITQRPAGKGHLSAGSLAVDSKKAAEALTAMARGLSQTEK